MIAVCLAGQDDFGFAILYLFNMRPNPLVREKENKTQRPDKPKSTYIPSNERGVEWVVLDRKYMGERRFFKFGETPFVARFRGSDRNIVRQLLSKGENSGPLVAGRRDVQDGDRIIVIA